MTRHAHNKDMTCIWSRCHSVEQVCKYTNLASLSRHTPHTWGPRQRTLSLSVEGAGSGPGMQQAGAGSPLRTTDNHTSSLFITWRQLQGVHCIFVLWAGWTGRRLHGYLQTLLSTVTGTRRGWRRLMADRLLKLYSSHPKDKSIQRG